MPCFISAPSSCLTPYQLKGVGQGAQRQGLWYNSHVMELYMGAVPFVPLLYTCTCLCAYAQDGTGLHQGHSGQAQRNWR